MEAKIGAMLLSAKEYLGPTEPGGGEEVFFTRAFRGTMANTLISDF